MIQDIAPKVLNIEYKNIRPEPNDFCFVFRDKHALAKTDGKSILLPTWGALSSHAADAVFLFKIDEQAYYLVELKDGFILEGFDFEAVRNHRLLSPRDAIFAEMTAYQLYCWYRDNRFCGRCGKAVVHDENERSLKCPDCGNSVYPKIAPAVIVAVTDGDKILMTKYNGRAYKGYALIAGFCEIGETAEGTVVREVLEEVGLRVKNVRYFASQPWGIDSNLLLGYFAELDEDAPIRLDEKELSLAQWIKRDDIDFKPDEVSLTNAMIRAFAEGKWSG